MGVFVGVKIRDRIDSCATGFDRSNINTLAYDHSTNAHRAKEPLVAGEYQYVDSPSVHVYGHNSSCLAGVYDEYHLSVLDCFADSFNIL